MVNTEVIGNHGGITHGLKKELQRFINNCNNTIIVFDLETNGLKPENSSVLSCSAIKFNVIGDGELVELERFNRYYFPKERFRSAAIGVNGLSKDKIKELRVGANYAEHFIDDKEFNQFCNGVKSYVSHNADFDSKFIEHVSPSRYFCTMKTNANIVCSKWIESKNEWKWPSLKETAKYYGIQVKQSSLHGSKYDTEITAEIFKKMIKNINNCSSIVDNKHNNITSEADEDELVARGKKIVVSFLIILALIVTLIVICVNSIN